MNELEHYRQLIDAVDEQLVALFERRMEISADIKAYKMKHQLPILNKQREQAVIEKNSQYLKDKTLLPLVRLYLQTLMDLSKKHQQFAPSTTSVLPSGKTGYFGEIGSYTQQAMNQLYGTITGQGYLDLAAAFSDLLAGTLETLVVPLENSFTGAVTSVYDLLSHHDVYCVDEVTLDIDHCLLGLPGTDRSLITSVHSHPQALAQCSRFIDRLGWHAIPAMSTSSAARWLSETSDTTQAAIASRQAAVTYRLDILETSIHNETDNQTRFVALRKDPQFKENHHKISVVFSLDDASGTLHRLLAHFADHEINLINIESRPTHNSNWEYLLYLDFEGNLGEERVERALALLNLNSPYYKLLGAY